MEAAQEEAAEARAAKIRASNTTADGRELAVLNSEVELGEEPEPSADADAHSTPQSKH